MLIFAFRRAQRLFRSAAVRMRRGQRKTRQIGDVQLSVVTKASIALLLSSPYALSILGFYYEDYIFAAVFGMLQALLSCLLLESPPSKSDIVQFVLLGLAIVIALFLEVIDGSYARRHQNIRFYEEKALRARMEVRLLSNQIENLERMQRQNDLLKQVIESNRQILNLQPNENALDHPAPQIP